MEYDYYRNRAGHSPYDPQIPAYRPPASSSSASSFYPRVGQPGQPLIPPAARAPPYQHTSAPSSSGTGIRVAIKSEHRITPPGVPYDFGCTPIQNLFKHFSMRQRNPPVDPIVSKYIASGLNREAVTLAVANYGDNPTKVQDFVESYNLLREMGFPSKSVTEALFMHENDNDKALAHLLNSSS